jgi:protein glucosyltransferase
MALAVSKSPLQRRRRQSFCIVSFVLLTITAFTLRFQRFNLSYSTVIYQDDDAIMETAIFPKEQQPTTHKSSPSPSSKSSKGSSDTCFTEFPWIQPALDIFYAPALKAFTASLQTTEESLKAMDNITWHNGYHPGHDTMILRYDDTLKTYKMTYQRDYPPNQPYKGECIQTPLKRAIETHGAALAEKFNHKELKFALVTEDFAINWRGSNSKLPAFTLCTDTDHSDIPVPDFTYGCYPETQYKNSSWEYISHRLATESENITWKNRYNTIFHRSNWGVGPRRGLMPLLEQLHSNKTDVQLLGGVLDIGDTGFQAKSEDKFVFLHEQCVHKAAIHTAGFSYSAGLKYKLACGQLVVHFESKYQEFYEPALEDGVHVVRVPAEEEGVDEEEFFEYSAPKIKKAVKAALSGKVTDVPEIAAAGQKFVLTQLTPEALSCYWYGALLRYGEMYFTEETEAQKEKKRVEEEEKHAIKIETVVDHER